MPRRKMTEAQREAKRIRDRNYRFTRMSRSRQRMAIARDVLKLLDIGKLTATRGTYFEVDFPSHKMDLNELPEEIKLKEFVAQPAVECQVCAIGGVFAAAVLARGIDGEERALMHGRRSNWDERGHSYVPTIEFDPPTKSDMVRELKPFFHARELDELEEYFENETCEYSANELESDESLRSAMEHIIATKGRRICPRVA